jgi:hypothetical protein
MECADAGVWTIGDLDPIAAARGWGFNLGTQKGGDHDGHRPFACCLRLSCYSWAGSGSIVRASTGTCTSSLLAVVIMKTRITGKASMKLK